MRFLYRLYRLVRAFLGFFNVRRFFQSKSAQFINHYQRRQIISPDHDGFLVDGHSERLDLKASCQNVITYAGTGKFKTQIQALPNVYRLAQQECSMLLVDVKGAMYRDTAGFIRKQGFDIKVLNLIDLLRSHRFNPQLALRDYTDLYAFSQAVLAASPVSGEQ